jgi:hypothetical protein
MWVDRETLRAIYQEIQRAALAAVAPFTRGGKLDLSSPNIVGHLPPARGGTGGTAAPPNAPFVYLTDADGAYLTDAAGAFLIEYTTEPETAATSITVEEVDGSPTVAATRLVLPNGTLGVVGTVATYTPAVSSIGDHALWKRKAALLDPACLEAIQYDAFNLTVSGNTKYLVTGFAVRLNNTGVSRIDTRDPAHGPLAMPVGTNLRGVGGGSHAFILDPERAVPHIANGYEHYHDRLLAIEDLPLRYVSVDGSQLFDSHRSRAMLLPGPYGIILRHITVFDWAWGSPATDRGGFLITPELGDTTAKTIRFGHNLTLPANLNICQAIVAGYPRLATTNDVLTVAYSVLPADWSDVPDAPNWREDALGAALDVPAKWRRAQTSAAYAEIDDDWQWIGMNGSGAANANALISVATFARADSPQLIFDVLPGTWGASAPELFAGFMTDGGSIANLCYRYALRFTGGTPRQINVVEQSAAGVDVVNTAVGDYAHGSAYRCRITLAATGATYEIQGGAEYPPIGGATWDDVTPGTTQGTTSPVSVGIQQAAAGVPSWVGNLRVYHD